MLSYSIFVRKYSEECQAVWLIVFYLVSGDTHRTVMHSYNSKKLTIQRLETQLKQIEQETAEKLEDIDKQNTQLKVGS